MIHLFSIILVFLASCAHAIDHDYNCTSYNGLIQLHVWNPSSFSCSNVISDEACVALYSKESSGTLVVGGYTQRPAKCFSVKGTPLVPYMQAAAVALCPKYCGYCCIAPAASCPNAQYPRLNCDTITSEQCQSTIWRPIIAQDCPASCGFCNMGGCVDAVTDCTNDPSICTAVGMQTFVNTYCQFTCGRCVSSTTASSSASSSLPASSTCSSYPADSSKNCAEWAVSGFCANTFYTIAQRKAYCATTCKLC